jgi:hypothetical protein
MARHMAANAAAPDSSRLLLDHVDKLDRTAPVEPPHQRNLAAAQRTGPVVPDNQFHHNANMGSVI